LADDFIYVQRNRRGMKFSRVVRISSHRGTACVFTKSCRNHKNST